MMALQGHVGDFAVFGDDYATPDGTAIRDYIHVTDLAAAHVQALKLLLQGHAGGVFNLGTGKGFSVREILRAIAAETGRDVPHTVKPRRSGDPTYLVADAWAARDVLRFIPKHSDLATIVRTAWARHKRAHPLKTGVPANGSMRLFPAARPWLVPRMQRSTPLAWCVAEPGPMKASKKIRIPALRCIAEEALHRVRDTGAQRLDQHRIPPVTHACARLASPTRGASIGGSG
jgi:hypothetical protein